MGQDPRGGAVQEQGEALTEGEEVEVGWGERAPEPDPVGIVSALVVGQDFLIKPGLPATTLVAPSAASRW